ncbi:MAG: DUF4407 domain-containing protein [Haliscomenobacter sp.]|nr:DUF4407 domain-containing protein [Haliscomenobacter sp.]MBK8880063.1 DUF4407 domain-containing protein [Haliscomenobacter sp.]
MKPSLYSFFVWSAGSDRQVLDRCGKSEHIKHAGYGGLVWVPAILGLFSMIYAISTLTDKWPVFVAAGTVWALIVFIFDRFIVSTFRKSESPRKDILSFLFFSRLLFSIGIGIVVSHPLVLLVFDDSLRQELLSMQDEGEEKLFSDYETSINVVRARDSLLKAEIEAKLFERQCKEKLLLFEMSGKDTTLNCGTTSGMQQYGPRSREIKEEITYLNAEIADLRLRNFDKINENNQEIAKLQKEREGKIAGFRDRFSTNYLAREIALERLMKEEVGGQTVRWTMWFLMVFFILVDILPVSFKAATKPGEYDRLLEQEGAYTSQSSPAYERAQEDLVRKSLVDQLTGHRIEKVAEHVSAWQGSFPALKEKTAEYINVEIPYDFHRETPPSEPFSLLGADARTLWMRAIRFLFFAILQAGCLYLITRHPIYLGWAIPLLFLLNFGVDYLVRQFFTSAKPA